MLASPEHYPAMSVTDVNPRTLELYSPELKPLTLDEKTISLAVLPIKGRETIEFLIHCDKRAVFAITGGGGQVISWLMDTPGVSNFFLEATVPYSRESIAAFLGREAPEHFVAKETAALMADRAFQRALFLKVPEYTALGAACTATIKTSVPKHGPHHGWLCIRTNARRFFGWVNLEKEKRSRYTEDHIVSDALLKLIAWASGSEYPHLNAISSADSWECFSENL